MVTGYPVWGVRGVLWGRRPCGVDGHLLSFLSPATHLLLQDLLVRVPQLSVSENTLPARRQVSLTPSHTELCGHTLQQKMVNLRLEMKPQRDVCVFQQDVSSY